jgi:hypothetical protein
MPAAYFIRRSGGVCAVIKLHADNREEVVQDGLSAIEAEILCEAKIADLPRAVAHPLVAPIEPDEAAPEPRHGSAACAQALRPPQVVWKTKNPQRLRVYTLEKTARGTGSSNA